MRNLKKILAMVLALIMSLSLMATAGAADFPDADKIGENYEVAVEVLNGLGVFKGYENGNFEPQGSITRAEVAAIIYRIATGDVNDAQTSIYSSWGMFEDVKDGQWYAGYVNYCANAGYIKGHNNVFDPNAQVTGYQALAMILRAVGYDKMGEFTGSNWQVNTAATARERGILKNITTGELGQSATREMVAEILFQAILIDKVNYTPALGYQVADTSVGYDSLGLEDLSGVVTGNEYADLYGSAPMKDGQTRLNVDGTDYVLEAGSVLTDIGERRHAYVTDKGANVLYHLYDAETDYTVAEPANDGGEGDTVADVARSQGLKLTADTEYYVNFGDPIDKYTSDYRVEYKIGLGYTQYQIMELLYRNGGTAKNVDGKAVGDPVKGVDKDAWDKFVSAYNRDADVEGVYTYDKVIRVGEEITAQDMIFIREIFYGSDSLHGNFDENYDIYFGEVYVATKSQIDNAGNSVDISDEISYVEFLDKYINDEFKDFSVSDNGEWLKIVDYDNDGNADYVMRTDFVMTTIVDHNTKTDVWFVEYLDYETGLPTEIDAADVSGKEALAFPNGDMKLVSAGNLGEGQVYMYTYIDGVYYITEPTKIETSVSKINYRAGTLDCADSETREWSGIDKKAIQYYTEIDEVSLNANYSMYLDQFGYIRLFTEADKGFVLLTDGYFETDRRTDAYKAEIWADSDNKTIDVDVVHSAANPATNFIWNNADREDNQNYHDDEGTWERLKEFGHVYYGAALAQYYGHWVDTQAGLAGSQIADPYRTNIAAYTVDDGKYTLGKVDMADTSRARYEAYAIDNTDLINGKGNGTVYSDDRTLYGITAWKDANTVDDSQNVRIQTTTETLYYYVDGDKITSWTGYNSSDAPARFQVTQAYAVGSFVPDRENGTNDNTLPYLVAEIVVIEGRYTRTVLAADFLYAMVEGGGRDHYLLGKGATDGSAYGEKVGRTEATTWNGLINFYDQDTKLITKDYENYGVFAGRVVTYDRVKGRNYVQLSVNKSELTGKRATNLNYGNPESWAWFYTDEIPLYNLTENTAYDRNTLRNFTTRGDSDIAIGDYVIYMVDASGSVCLVINVSESKTTGGDSIKKLDDLWNAISRDQISRYNVLPFSFYGKNTTDATPADPTTLNASSAAAVSGKTYMGSVTVPYDDAVAAGTNHWVGPNAVNYTMIATPADTNFGTTVGYPGVPEPNTGMAYIVVIGDNWWLLRQQSRTATVWNLESSNLNVLVTGGDNPAPTVTVFDPTMTLRQLASYLTSDKGTVTVKMNARNSTVYMTNPDVQIYNINTSNYEVGIYVGNTLVATTANSSLIFLPASSDYGTISWDNAVVDKVLFDGKEVKNGQHFKTSDYNGKFVYVTLRDTVNYKVTNGGATYNAAEGKWSFSYGGSGNVVIAVEGYTARDRVQAVVSAYAAAGNLKQTSYIVSNDLYKVTPDAAAIEKLEEAIEKEVAVQAQREIAALGFNGVQVTASLAASSTSMETPGTNVYSGSVDLTLTLNGASMTVTNAGTISATIAYADLSGAEAAIDSALGSARINSGSVKADITAAINSVPGVTMIDLNLPQGIFNTGDKMSFTYRFNYGGTDSGVCSGVVAIS